MKAYRSPFGYDGYGYEIALPDGWSSHIYSADGEKEFLVHENAAGSMLYIQMYRRMRVSARVRIPDGITDPVQRVLYAAAASRERHLATNMLTGTFRYFLFGAGRGAKVNTEAIGKLKGFTFLVNRKVSRRDEIWWCAYWSAGTPPISKPPDSGFMSHGSANDVACEQTVIHTRYVMAGTNNCDQELSVVRDVLKSFRLVKRPVSPT